MEKTPQPIPDIRPEDIRRIVHRDFPESQFDAVMELLSEYGMETWHRETYRVRAATLKLAEGNLNAVRKHIEVAKQDYRDTLVVAEYPEYWRADSSRRSGKERDRIVARDRKQYEIWFNK